MNLAIITQYWKSIHGGGINTFTVGFIETLNHITDIQVKIGYIDGNGNGQYKITEGTIPSIFGTITALNKIKPEVIQIHEYWPLLVGCSLYKFFNKKIKLVYVPLTEPMKPNSMVKMFNHFLRLIALKWSFKQCDKVIIGCKEFQKIYESYYKLSIGNKASYIGMAIKGKDVTNEELTNFRKQFGIKKDSIVLLIQAFTATELKAEGIKLSIKMLKELRKKYPNIVLILTREGIFSNDLKKYVKKEKMEDCVIFTGDIDNPFIPLQICDIFLWPWLGRTGFGLALLEAMLIGKPIVATTVTGTHTPLVDHENGLLVTPEAKQIANAVDQLLNNKELANELGKNAQKNVLNNYTWEKIVEEYLRLYGIN